MSTYITVAIPYVNAEPHIGYAFELVEADVAARARRALGEPVRFLGGTDEYSLKNVLAAEAAGEPVRTFVDRHADRFEQLPVPLAISFDDFIRTSRDRRHRPAVERLWRACADRGDLYRRGYTGSYCVGCEQFYDPADLEAGQCPEHHAPVDTVTETNWFFRLSDYSDQLIALIESNELRITPAPFRDEILAFARRGLDDISVSRSVERAHGWGIGVPDDPSQVIYVWFDALTNYVSALDYGTDSDNYYRWWRNADERIHVVGKGITRFHAIYWPAFLLSASERPPTRIHVHPYLSVNGAKISKSTGSGPKPTDLADTYGSDALRWWITNNVSAVSDTDFTIDRLVDSANTTLANGLGNAINRITTIRHRTNPTARPKSNAEPLPEAADLQETVAAALANFDRRSASNHVKAAIDAVNRHIETTAPWQLAKHDDQRDRLDDLLATYISTLTTIAHAIEPITPDLAARAVQQLTDNPLSTPTPIYRRLSSG